MIEKPRKLFGSRSFLPQEVHLLQKSRSLSLESLGQSVDLPGPENKPPCHDSAGLVFEIIHMTSQRCKLSDQTPAVCILSDHRRLKQTLTSPSHRAAATTAPAARSAVPGPAAAPGWSDPAHAPARRCSASAWCSPPWWRAARRAASGTAAPARGGEAVKRTRAGVSFSYWNWLTLPFVMDFFAAWLHGLRLTLLCFWKSCSSSFSLLVSCSSMSWLRDTKRS